jgi:hypothetical protein
MQKHKFSIVSILLILSATFTNAQKVKVLVLAISQKIVNEARKFLSTMDKMQR